MLGNVNHSIHKPVLLPPRFGGPVPVQCCGVVGKELDKYWKLKYKTNQGLKKP